MDISSILSEVASNYQSTLASGSAADASSSSFDFKHITIGQIRDITDKMAIDGKLTAFEQLALILNGMQDMDASDPSYQPAGQEGYSRADTATYDIVAMMNSSANFADSVGNFHSANTYKGAADAIQQYENEISAASASQSP